MSDSSASCPSDAFFGNPVKDVAGSFSYHKIATIVSAVCAIVTLLVCSGLAVMHLLRYNRSHEQRQIVRIVATPAIIAVFTFFGVCFYEPSGYLRPIGEYYESFALTAIFLLFITYSTPAEERRANQFDYLEPLQMRNGGASVSAYYRTWVFVFQIIPVRLITLIAILAVSGSECKLLQHNTKAHTAINAISTISTILAFIAILRLTKLLKPTLNGYRPVSKLLTLKIIVALDVLQTLIFSALNSAGDIKPTTHLNLPDLLIGTPGLLLCCECMLFSLLFLWSFNPNAYPATQDQGASTHLGFFAALFDVLNISDIIMGVLNILNAWQGWKGGEDTQAEYQEYNK